MQEGRPVWYAFALPIVSICFIVGVLCSKLVSLSGIVILIIFCSFAIINSWDWAVAGVFSFFAGVIRSQIPLNISPLNPFGGLRRQFEESLRLIVSGPEHTLLSGILFGGSSGFSKQWRTIFITTGTMHIVAVSGSNLSFYVQWLEKVLRKFRCSPRARMYVAALILGAYIFITGAPASVVRAGIMAGIMVIAPLIGRQGTALHALAGAAFLMVVAQPTIAFDMGFQLSCLATLGLMILDSGSSSLAQALQETIAASLCVLPLESFYFGRISIVALIANALVAPLIPIIMIAGLLFFGLVQILSTTVLHVGTPILEFILSLMLRILEASAQIPGASAQVQITLPLLIGYYSMIIIYMFFRYQQRCRL